jgi:hypothetical protein
VISLTLDEARELLQWLKEAKQVLVDRKIELDNKRAANRQLIESIRNKLTHDALAAG